jgi:hypothetical protein
MVSIPKISALFETSLASSLSAAGTSFTVVSGTDRDGNALSGLYGFIIDEGSADEEFVVGTISGTTVTISKRGCDADDPETEVSANKKAHRRGASVKITDYPIMAYIRNIMAGESGYTLPTLLRYASNVGNPTNDYDIAYRAWVLSVVNGGAVSHDRIIVAGNAGETISAAGKLVYFDDTDNEWKLSDADSAVTVENVILGIAQGAGVDGGAISGGVLLFGIDSNQSGLTIGQKYFASNTAGGISSSAGTKEVSIGFAKSITELYFCPRFDQQLTEDEQDAVASLAQAVLPYAADAGSTDAYAVTLTPAPAAYTAGMVVHFKANTVNTGAATLNVNGLGAKTIVKSLNLTLHDGDIKAGQLVSVIYDGTNFQLLSPVTGSYNSGVTTRDLSVASGSQTIAHGLGAIPKRIKIKGVFSTSSTTIAFNSQSEGVYDGTNTRCIYSTILVGSAPEFNTSTSFIIKLMDPSNWATYYQTATVTFDATNITLTWTKNGSPTGTAQILWEAFA